MDEIDGLYEAAVAKLLQLAAEQFRKDAAGAAEGKALALIGMAERAEAEARRRGRHDA